jgi:mono/diheme cytochrome c family protein
MRVRALNVTLLTCLAASALAAQSLSQPAVSVSAGVYTDEQAARGRVVARDYCVHCHAADWTGLDGPPLVGDAFTRQWGPRTLRRLFDKIADTMPPGDADSVSDAEALDVVAFLLQQNGFPAGRAELSSDAPVLAASQPIVPSATPSVGSLVQAAGCLRGAGQEWMLTRSSEPTFAAPGTDARGARPVPMPGSATVRLMNVFPAPTDKAGRVVRVSGLLVADTTPFVVNVVSLEVAGPEC